MKNIEDNMDMFIKNINRIIRKNWFILTFGVILLFVLFLSNMAGKNDNLPKISPYPNGKDFAFTITDDPDGNKLEKVRPIYQFLSKIGMKTTVAVWVQDPDRSDGIPDTVPNRNYGDSCDNKNYLEFIQKLQNDEFEIALHTASAGNDIREKTIQGYEKFKTFFGSYPKINIMHSNNLENVYWGQKVVDSRFVKFLIGLSSRKGKFPYAGEIKGSPYFWGDILKSKTKYVRLWGTSDINTLKFNPSMPYHDPKKVYVNYWFSFSDGYDVDIFNELISKKNVKKLKYERGTSIVYTHFSAGFTEKKKNETYIVNKQFKSLMTELAKDEQGWFVPSSDILDRLLQMKKIELKTFSDGILVINGNKEPVHGLTILTKNLAYLYDSKGNRVNANKQGEIILDKINPKESLVLFYNTETKNLKREYPGTKEKLNLFFSRALVYIKHRVIRF